MLTPAPSPATVAPASSIERLIGEVTATAAAALAKALAEYWTGGLTRSTKSLGGDWIAQLYELRRATLTELNFEKVARVHGMQVLRERGGDMKK
jgi:GAF domain-containing protein